MRAALLCFAISLGIAGCTTPLDLDAATAWLTREKTPVPPELRELGEDNAAGHPAPQGLRATSGQLRKTLLQLRLHVGHHQGHHLRLTLRQRKAFLDVRHIPLRFHRVLRPV